MVLNEDLNLLLEILKILNIMVKGELFWGFGEYILLNRLIFFFMFNDFNMFCWILFDVCKVNEMFNLDVLLNFIYIGV